MRVGLRSIGVQGLSRNSPAVGAARCIVNERRHRIFGQGDDTGGVLGVLLLLKMVGLEILTPVVVVRRSVREERIQSPLGVRFVEVRPVSIRLPADL